MKTARLLEVIETITTRGDGCGQNSPIRTVTQYWSKDGRLLAESDLMAATLSPERIHTLNLKLKESHCSAAVADKPLTALLRPQDFPSVSSAQ